MYIANIQIDWYYITTVLQAKLQIGLEILLYQWGKENEIYLAILQLYLLFSTSPICYYCKNDVIRTRAQGRLKFKHVFWYSNNRHFKQVLSYISPIDNKCYKIRLTNFTLCESCETKIKYVSLPSFCRSNGLMEKRFYKQIYQHDSLVCCLNTVYGPLSVFQHIMNESKDLKHKPRMLKI